MDTEYNRRDFVRLGATFGAGLALDVTNFPTAAKASQVVAPVRAATGIDRVRLGLVGVGGRGSYLGKILMNMKGTRIRAVCDIIPERVQRVQKWVEQAGQPKPVGYWRSETDFKRLCEQEDIDLVITATPWRWHVPVCVAAMKAGKHAATEVPAAVTLDECWQLVETSENTGKYCVMLENCCYGRSEMMVLNMVRKGLLGELLHGEVGYLHDCRALTLNSTRGKAWSRQHSIERNGNLYPTHGLGPVAQCMNINRGDRFDYLVSMSSKSRGLNLYAEKKFGPDHQLARQKYAQGDVNVSLIRTVNGLSITIYYDCRTPRPYSRINLVQGTKGIFRGYPDRIYIEGKSASHAWEPADKYQKDYDHPLWKALGNKAGGFGHGGMDYMVVYRLMQALHTGTPPDMDVYDAAAWSVVSELSERSVANKSRPMDFPDFTRGKWKTNPPLCIVEA